MAQNNGSEILRRDFIRGVGYKEDCNGLLGYAWNTVSHKDDANGTFWKNEKAMLQLMSQNEFQHKWMRA